MAQEPKVFVVLPELFVGFLRDEPEQNPHYEYTRDESVKSLIRWVVQTSHAHSPLKRWTGSADYPRDKLKQSRIVISPTLQQ